jgi:hypothetical protein
MALTALTGPNHFWFGSPGGILNGKLGGNNSRLIMFKFWMVVAAALYYTGNTGGGGGFFSKFLDILPLEMLGTPQFVYENLVKFGLVVNLLMCHPSPVAKLFSAKFGASVQDIQKISVIGLITNGFLYHNGYHNYDFYDALLVCVAFGYGLAFCLKFNKQFAMPMFLLKHVFLALYLECLNAGTAKITNYQHALLSMAVLFGGMALTSQGGGRGRPAGAAKSRSRSRKRA